MFWGEGGEDSQHDGFPSPDTYVIESSLKLGVMKASVQPPKAKYLHPTASFSWGCGGLKQVNGGVLYKMTQRCL